MSKEKEILNKELLFKYGNELDKIQNHISRIRFVAISSVNSLEEKDKEIERLNNIINELDKQNGELGADLSIIKDRVIKTNWWLENMLKQATNRETKAIINEVLDLLLGSD